MINFYLLYYWTATKCGRRTCRLHHVSNTYHIYYVPTQCSSLLIFFSIQTTLPQGFLKRYQEHHFIKMLTLTNHIKWNRDQCSKLFHCTVLNILWCHLVVNKSTDNGKMYRYMMFFNNKPKSASDRRSAWVFVLHDGSHQLCVSVLSKYLYSIDNGQEPIGNKEWLFAVKNV